jgi:hypothetical protein
MVEDDRKVIDLEAWRNIAWQRQRNNDGPKNPKPAKKDKSFLYLLLGAIASGAFVGSVLYYENKLIQEQLTLAKEVQSNSNTQKDQQELINRDIERIKKIIPLTPNDINNIIYFSRLTLDSPLNVVLTVLREEPIYYSEIDLERLKQRNIEKYNLVVKILETQRAIKKTTKIQLQQLSELLPLFPKQGSEFRKYFDRMLELKDKFMSPQRKSIYREGVNANQQKETKDRTLMREQNKKAAIAKVNARKQMLKPRLRA